MEHLELKGIIPPIITPMFEDETVNYEELRNQVNRMIEGGVHGLFPKKIESLKIKMGKEQV